jgi:hypothetical protein
LLDSGLDSGEVMMFEWQQQGDSFITPFPAGRAVITERRRRGFGVPIGGEYAYDARLEDAAGTVLDSISDMRLFEDAEDWVAAVLPAHRRALKYPARRNRKI